MNITDLFSNATNTQNQTVIVTYTLVWYQFVYSSICFFGATTVSINISVFVNKKLTDRTYTFLLIESIVDMLYICMMGFSSVINCGTPCQSRSNTLWALIIRYGLYEYLTSCFAINNILIQIYLSLDRLLIISNRSQTIFQKLGLKPTISAIGLFSLAYYSPVLFIRKYVALGDGTWKLFLTDFGMSKAGRLIPGVLSTIRLILVTICLFSINMITFVKFKRHVNKKSKLTFNPSQISKSAGSITLLHYIYLK